MTKRKAATGSTRHSTTTEKSRRPTRTRAKGEGATIIAEVAKRAFAEKGYDGISIREIAQRADVSLSTMYWFYPSKQDLLGTLIEESANRYLEIYEKYQTTSPDDPLARLDAFVGAVVEYRARFQLESNMLDQIRNVAPDLRSAVDAANNESRADLVQIVAAGVEGEVFKTPYPDDARRAITAMCNAVARWYDPKGGIPVDEIISRHRFLARELVGAQP